MKRRKKLRVVRKAWAIKRGNTFTVGYKLVALYAHLHYAMVHAGLAEVPIRVRVTVEEL